MKQQQADDIDEGDDKELTQQVHEQLKKAQNDQASKKPQNDQVSKKELDSLLDKTNDMINNDTTTNDDNTTKETDEELDTVMLQTFDKEVYGKHK
jgi:DNA mismatch repair ATPase MutS